MKRLFRREKQEQVLRAPPDYGGAGGTRQAELFRWSAEIRPSASLLVSFQAQIAALEANAA
jgi:hypothetical protein